MVLWDKRTAETFSDIAWVSGVVSLHAFATGNLSFAKERNLNHHGLNQTEINIQSKHAINLAAIFDTAKLQFTHIERTNLDFITTGCLLENNAKINVLSTQVKQIHFYKEFIDGRFGKRQQRELGSQ